MSNQQDILESILMRIKEEGKNFNQNDLNQEEYKVLLDYLRSQSRNSYINKAEEQRVSIFNNFLKEEKKVFKDVKLTKKEERLKKLNERIKKISKKVKNQKPQQNQNYQMPIDVDEDEQNKNQQKNSILQRYQEEQQQQEKSEDQLWTEEQILRVFNKNNQDFKQSFYLNSQSNLKASFEQEINIQQQKEDLQNKKIDIQSQKQQLPIYQYKQEIIESIAKNKVTILVGETGSGKTTQVPQYLYESGFAQNGCIAITQPRRVAAMSIASRVAEELNFELGYEVGYSVRFENNARPETAIKFYTDGKLLQEFQSDPQMKNFSVIIIDEAHERSLSSDILLSMLKELIMVREDLRLVVSSATLNAEIFKEYFQDATVLKIPGRRFEVDIYYTKQPEPDYVQASVMTVLQIHVTQKEGDILVFLTGQDDIEQAEIFLNQRSQNFGRDIKNLWVLPLYSNLDTNRQKLVFEQTPENTRKVILSTNIAETSLTINGIVYVIDCGFAKQKSFNPQLGHESLVITPISKANADQRAGRAGRICPGKCFRLYTAWSFQNQLQDQPTPEIQRSDLCSLILKLKSMGVDNLVDFDFIHSPNKFVVINALEKLFFLKALDQDGELTQLGQKMSEFPISPQQARALINSEQYKCIQQCAIIIAVLNAGGNLFYRPKNKQLFADTAKKSFNQQNGDPQSILEIYRQWEESGYSTQFCKDYYLQYRTLVKTRDIKDQLLKIALSVGIDVDDKDNSTVDQNYENIKKCLLSGFFMNFAKKGFRQDYITIKKSQKVMIHPSSYTSQHLPDYVSYCELVLTNQIYMRMVFESNIKWAIEVSEGYYSDKDFEKDKMENFKHIINRRTFESIRDRHKRFLSKLKQQAFETLKKLSVEEQQKKCIIFDKRKQYKGYKNIVMDEEDLKKKKEEKEILKQQKKAEKQKEKEERQKQKQLINRKNRNKRYTWILIRLKDFKDQEYQYTHQKLFLKDVLDLLIEQGYCKKQQVYKCLNQQKGSQNLKNIFKQLGLDQENFQLNQQQYCISKIYMMFMNKDIQKIQKVQFKIQII